MLVLRIALIVAVAVVGCRRPVSPPPEAPPDVARRGALQSFSATAYSIEGRTASGVHTRRGIVAADPRVLPIGSRLRVPEAGEYDGEYVVHDTGPAIRGREIDIYVPSDAAAKRFGRRTVKVEVLSRGERR